MNLARYYEGLNKRDKEAFKRAFGAGLHPEHTESLKEYIDRTGCRTESRISKRGINLTKVFFENGTCKEYETERLDTITAFQN